MKYKFSFTLICAFYSLVAMPQKNESIIDSLLEKKITVSGFCLCRTTITDLKKIDKDLKRVNVEEMDLCNDGFTQDVRFENQKGYYSTSYPGIIFQKDNDNDFISKIRLTKDFIGKLPDGTFINMKDLQAKDILKIYPNFDIWRSRGCSDYWNLTNDTLSFLLKSIRTKNLNTRLIKLII
ncbi:hypothetical protein A4D02_34610 [Niastella koreensis]|uniref:Uncharacterized protein n=2 Tax=Niastella koreensis TaxID=354356 RepID=G8TRR4_NIAKG|nr:hypothetical protein [Niastella koreensis]AEW02211.1 hypothetical protein Niako_5982 [Niastella koreensis GR20-10]OQP45085.1 hypothetical protein A4D02_34610 [Niastella koreensis]